MNEPTIEVPVSCPVCEKERLCALPVAATASALLNRESIKLTCTCQMQWNASDVEREQIREYLAMLTPSDTVVPAG
jgi:hypothetical protein